MPINYSNLRPVDPVLTGFMASLAPDPVLIGRALTPRVAVDNPDFIGKVWLDTHESFMGTPQALELQPGVPMPTMASKDPSTVSYECVPYGLASKGIPKRGAARSQLPEDLVQRELRMLRNALLIAEEIRYATLYQSSGNWTTTSACNALSGGAKWSSLTSTPLVDLHGYIGTYVEAAHGAMPTDLILPYAVARAIGATADARGFYVANLSGGQSAAATAGRPLGVERVAELLASEFGLKVHIGRARKNTANLGQSHSESYIWTDTVWLGTLNADAGVDGRSVRTIRSAALGIDERSLIGEGGLGGLDTSFSAGVDEIAPSQGDAWVPYVQHCADELKLAADLGATITDCL